MAEDAGIKVSLRVVRKKPKNLNLAGLNIVKSLGFGDDLLRRLHGLVCVAPPHDNRLHDDSALAKRGGWWTGLYLINFGQFVTRH